MHTIAIQEEDLPTLRQILTQIKEYGAYNRAYMERVDRLLSALDQADTIEPLTAEHLAKARAEGRQATVDWLRKEMDWLTPQDGAYRALDHVLEVRDL